MTDEHMTSGAYIIQEERCGPYLLQVMDREKGQFHSTRLSLITLARLAYECADRVHVALGATDMKAAHEEIAVALSSEWGKPK